MAALNSLYRSVSVFTVTYDYLKRSFAQDADHTILKERWAEDILAMVNVEVQVLGQVSLQKPLLFVGNHISYLDIALLMRTTPDISFVAKEEISRWPVIGRTAKAANTIFVKRECGAKRAAARASLVEALENGARIALFPSGTTTLKEDKPWRRGAFEIAQMTGVPIQPFRVRYTPLRTAAYIDRDFFPLHLYQLAQCGQVKATIEFHPVVHVTDINQSCEEWRKWSQA